MITHSETIKWLRAEALTLTAQLDTKIMDGEIAEIVELVEQLSLIAVAWQTVAHILTNPNPND